MAVDSLRATRFTQLNTVCITGDSPTISPYLTCTSSLSHAFSTRSATFSLSRRSRSSRAFRIRSIFTANSSVENGLVRKSVAPSFIASTAVSSVPYAVRTRTSVPGDLSFT